MKNCILVFLALFAGCVSMPPEPEDFSAELPGDALPVLTAFTLERPDGKAEKSEQETQSVLDDTRSLDELLLKPLLEAGPRLFAFVDASGLDGPAALAEARKKGADLVVSLRPKKADVAYVGRNAWALPNLAIWFFTWFAAWYVPDETWALDLEIGLDVLDAKSGETLLRKDLAYRLELRLNDFHRGWNFLGTFFGPPSDRDTYLNVAEHLRPCAFRHIQAQAVRALAIDLREAISRRGWRPKGESLALVCGFDGSSAKAAGKDAEAFAAALEAGGFPKERIRLVTGGSDAARRLETELGKIAAAPFPERREVLLYVAGSGFLAETPGGLVPALGAPEKSVTLTALLKKLGAFRKASMIVDAGFGGAGQSRSAGGVPVTEGNPAPWREGAKSAGIPVFLATAPGKPAFESADLGHGIFTATLIDGLKGAADTNGNKKVTLGELETYLQSQVRGLAMIQGWDQDPQRIGGEDEEELLPRD